MMKVKYIQLCVTCLILTGCINATMTSSPISEYGPVEQSIDKKGVIEYLDNSNVMDAIRKANRKSAYKQMFNVCNGKYTITNEYTRNDAEVVQGSTLSLSQVKTVERYKVIEFKCL